jgi:hypothetical protein
MKTIKNSKELSKLVNKHKDLIFPNEDIRIEFEPTKEEIRNVECRDLFLTDDKQNFDFNGSNFNGRNFNGKNFNGDNFDGDNFDGEKIFYYAFFICYGDCRYTEIKGQRKNSFHKCLDGKFIKRKI